MDYYNAEYNPSFNIIWSTLNPNENLWIIIAIGLGIAISSATQDITIDALRIEQIRENETKTMAASAAIQVVGWWTGYKIGGVISLTTAEFFQQKGYENYWQIIFFNTRVSCFDIKRCINLCS